MGHHAKAPSAGSSKGQAIRLGNVIRGAFVTRGASPRVLVAAVAALLALALPAAVSAAPPALTIGPASEVTFTEAHFSGTVDPSDHETNYHFEYVTDAQFNEEPDPVGAPGVKAEWLFAVQNGFGSLTAGAGATPVSVDVGGLNPSTTYHLRLVAENIEGEKVEAVAATFTTNGPITPPVVSNVSVEGVSAKFATATADVELADSDAGFNASTCRFEYLSQAEWEANGGAFPEPEGAPSAGCDVEPAGMGTTSTKATLNLSPSTKYHIRLVAANLGGADSAEAPSAVTTQAPLTVTLAAATEVTDTGATLHGSADPAGVETTECKFILSLNLEFSDIPCAEGNAFSSARDVSAVLTNLQPSSTYQYNLSVKNADGRKETDYGQFRTSGPPTLSRTFVSEVSAKAATLNADLTSNGHPTDYHFEYVSDADYQATGFSSAIYVPLPDATLAADATTVTVGESLSTLQPGTHYHYRIIAENSSGPISGPERVFRTDPIRAPVQPGQYPGQGFLPDDRAWEMVSPPDKNGTSVRAGNPFTAASPDGDRVGYTGSGSFADAHGSGAVGNVQYVATRGGDGWSSRAVTPGSKPGENQTLTGATLGFYSEDLSRVVFLANDLPAARDDIPEGSANLYRVDADGNGLRTLSTPFDPDATNPFFEFGASNNYPIGGDSGFDRYFFRSLQPLLPGTAPFQFNVYEWHQDAADAHQELTVKATGGTYCLEATTARGKGRLANGSNVITQVELISTRGTFHVGDTVSGVGIPDATTIVATGPDTLELSNPVGVGGNQTLRATETSAAVSATATASELEAALQALPGVGPGNIAIAGGPGDAAGSAPYEISFTGVLSGALIEPLKITNPGLSGGDETATVTVDELGGNLRVAGVLPDGSVAPGGSEEVIDGYGRPGTADVDTVSPDGSRVLFRAAPAGLSPQLYVRRSHTDTAWISEPEGTNSPSDPLAVTYQAASRDLKKVLFTTTSQLNDEDPGGSGNALYVYTDSANPDTDQNLEFLYRSNSNDITVVGTSEDGMAGYFAAGPLYHWSSAGVGTPIDVNTAQMTSALNGVHSAKRMSRVSADGTTVAFLQLVDVGGKPGVDNRHTVFYVYDADTGELSCASCPPSGAPVTGDSWLWPEFRGDTGFGGEVAYPRFLTADGSKAFFSTPDALVPEDINGRYDAYQYDIATGTPHLLSSGRSKYESWFANASGSGDDVFIVTPEALSGHDVDHAYDLYDARVGGGLAEPLPSAPACEGDACQPPPVNLNDPTPASEAFLGSGNVRSRKQPLPCKRGRKHRAGKCRRGQRPKRANSNRRAGE